MAHEFRQVETRLVLDTAKPISSRIPLRTPEDAVQALAQYLKDKDREYCVIVNLDSLMHPINFHILTKGGISSAIVPMEKVFQSAVLSNASAIMMLHNHPSASVAPSAYDLETTRRLVMAGQVMHIPVCDHVIVAAETGDYCSIRETNAELFENQSEMELPLQLEDSGRNRLGEIMGQLEEGVRGIFTSERYQKYLQTMSKFHRYSVNNTVLIAMQKPDATLVAGYDAWKKKFGRQVKKGEKGIQILCPAPVKETRKETFINEDGQEQELETQVLTTRFRVGTVFDISQTQGAPLPTISPKELAGKVAMHDDLVQIITEIAPAHVRHEDISDGAKGYYNLAKKEIVIRNGLPEAQELKTLIHETAHAILHNREALENDGMNKDRQTKEVEAESVAYCVSAALGLDTGDYSFPYIAGWSEGKDTKILQASLNTIRTASDSLISSIEEKLQSIDRFEVYQISDNGKLNGCQFLPYQEVKGHGIHVSDYDRVYLGKLKSQDLESLYQALNTGLPEGYLGHSLSVSDVVLLHHDGLDEAYYVDAFGFQKLEDFKKQKSIESEKRQEKEDEYERQDEKEAKIPAMRR